MGLAVVTSRSGPSSGLPFRGTTQCVPPARRMGESLVPGISGLGPSQVDPLSRAAQNKVVEHWRQTPCPSGGEQLKKPPPSTQGVTPGSHSRE